MGTPLIWLWGLVLLSSGGLRAQDPTDVAELRAEFDAIKILIDTPETFEEGRRRIHGFAQRLIDDPDIGAGLLYTRTVELARSPDWTPSGLDRAHYFSIAADAAVRMERPTLALAAAQESAQLHVALGNSIEAAAVLGRVLAGPAAGSPHCVLAQVELAVIELSLGHHRRAMDLAEEVARSKSTEPWARRARDASVLLRSSVARELGSPERFRSEVESLAVRCRAEADAPLGHSVEVELLRIASASGNHGSVRREATGLLEAGAALSNGQRAELLLLRGTSRLEGERTERLSGTKPNRRAYRDFQSILELSPGGRDAFFARTRLAEEALERGALGEARGHVDALEVWDGQQISTVIRVDARVLASRVARESGSSDVERGAAGTRLADDWSRLLFEWDSAPSGEQGVAFLKYAHRRAVLSELIEVELAHDPSGTGIERSLELIVSAQERSALAASLRTSESMPGPSTLERIRRGLLVGENHGLLVFLPARNGSHAFAIDRTSLSHHRLPSSSSLTGLRAAWVSWLSLSDVESLEGPRLEEVLGEERARAREFAMALLPEDLARRVAPWSMISVSGTDLLGPLPLAWLPLDGEPYLGLARSIDELPSIPHALRASHTQRPAGRAKGLLLLTDAAPGSELRERWPDLDPLRLGNDVRRGLEDIYPGPRLSILTGDRAQACGLSTVDLSTVETLQFFGHAVNVAGVRVPRSLALSPCSGPGERSRIGLFGAEEIASLVGAPELVIMTACASGQGPILRGDPHAGNLVGAWLRHGARSVIASQRDLSLAEGRRTARSLHAALGRGESPAEALRSLRREVVAARGAMAPFVLGMQQASGLAHRTLSSGAFGPGGASAISQPDGSVLGSTPVRIGVSLGAILALGFVVRHRGRRSRPA